MENTDKLESLALALDLDVRLECMQHLQELLLSLSGLRPIQELPLNHSVYILDKCLVFFFYNTSNLKNVFFHK